MRCRMKCKFLEMVAKNKDVTDTNKCFYLLLLITSSFTYAMQYVKRILMIPEVSGLHLGKNINQARIATVHLLSYSLFLYLFSVF
jgi:hypothetical protein